MGGGGGTDFRPRVRVGRSRRASEPDALIYFTDMCGPFPTEDPGYPVIWCATTRKEGPFGKTIHIDVYIAGMGGQEALQMARASRTRTFTVTVGVWSHAYWLYTPAAKKDDHSDVTDGRAQICLFAQRRIYVILRDRLNFDNVPKKPRRATENRYKSQVLTTLSGWSIGWWARVALRS